MGSAERREGVKPWMLGCNMLWSAYYYDCGFPAVEAELNRLMEEK